MSCTRKTPGSRDLILLTSKEEMNRRNGYSVYGAEMAPHMYYGPVAHVASLQSMAAVRNFLIQEWDAAMEPTFTGITRGTFPAVKNGEVILSRKPGLGLEMDWAELDRRFPYKQQSLRPPGGR